jgi:hypothetical protein
MVDRWDRTAETGNETEVNVLVAALCVGLAFITAGALMPGCVKLSQHRLVQTPHDDRLSDWPLAPPLPSSSPPIPLRV